MITWCAVSPDKRYLRRVKKDQSQKSSSNASGPSNSSLIVLLPNVYPQGYFCNFSRGINKIFLDKNQMEDKLTPSMLSNGYQHQSLSVEYDTHFVKFNFSILML
jgi:hypothetical protein